MEESSRFKERSFFEEERRVLFEERSLYEQCSKCCAMDSFGTYLQHVQTCNNVRVQSAMSTASVHILQMSKPMIVLVFKMLRN